MDGGSSKRKSDTEWVCNFFFNLLFRMSLNFKSVGSSPSIGVGPWAQMMVLNLDNFGPRTMDFERRSE
jgi:hypothetical protein